MKKHIAAAKQYALDHAEDIYIFSAVTTVGIFGMVYGYGIGKMLTTRDLRNVSALAKVVEKETSDTLTVYVKQRNGTTTAFDWIVPKNQ